MAAACGLHGRTVRGASETHFSSARSRGAPVRGESFSARRARFVRRGSRPTARARRA